MGLVDLPVLFVAFGALAKLSPRNRHQGPLLPPRPASPRDDLEGGARRVNYGSIIS
jgi:hypothetical protein